MNAQFYRICEQILSATVNGVYQGVLVTVVVGLALRWLIRTNAATRHAIWFGTLLLVATLIPAHLFLSWRPHSESTAAATPVAPPPPAVYDVAEDSVVVPPPPAAFESEPQSGNEARAEADDAARVEAGDQSPVPQMAPVPLPPSGNINTTAPAVSPAVPPWRQAFASVNSLLAKLPGSIHLPHSVSLGLIGAWILLAGIRGTKVLGGLVQIRRAKLASTAPSIRLQQLFDQLCASTGTTRPVGLRASNIHPTAMALGFFHPVVLLPAELDGDAANPEAEHVLRHELAHIERRDDWGNLTQQIIEAALFFHPAVWWISSRLSLEREIACDDLVLEASGQARGYALTLANAAFRMANHRQLIAPGVFGNSSQLQQRITMILNTQRDRSSRLAKRWLGFFATAAAALAALAIVAGPRVVLAGTTAAAADPTTPDATPAPAQDVAVGTSAAAGPSSSETGPRWKPGQTAEIATTATPEAPEAPEPAEPPEPPEPPPAPEAPPMPEVPGVMAVAPTPAAPAVPTAPMVVWTTPTTATMTLPQVALVTRQSDNENDDDPDVAPAGVPKDETQPRHKDRKDMSIEQRLDRIERILDRLQGRDGGKFGYHGPGPATVAPGAPGVVTVRPDLALNFDFAAKEADRAAADAKRAAEAGQRAAEAGQRAAEKAMRDMDRMQGQNMENMEKWQKEHAEGSQHELDALRQARDSLQSQVRSLEQQIRSLEADQRRLEGEKRRFKSDQPGDKAGTDGKSESKGDSEDDARRQ